MMALSSFVQHEPAPYDLLLLSGMLLFVLSGQNIPAKLAWPALSIVVLIFGYFIGALFAQYQRDAFLYIGTSTYLSVSLIFFAALVWRSPERTVPMIAGGLVIASAFAAGLGIAGYFGLVPNAESFAIYGRATGAFKDPNVFGPSLIFPALYLVQRMMTRRAAELVWSFPLLMTLLVALFLSFSRGAWMNFVASALVYWIVAWATGTLQVRRRLFGLGLIMILAATLGIAWILSFDGVRGLFMQRFALSQDYDGGTGGRFDNMYDAFLMAMRYPLGIGPDQWPHISPSNLMPHNIYVNVLVSGGVISFIGFASLTIMTLSIGFRGIARNAPMAGVLIVAVATFAGHALEGIIIDSNHWRHLYVVIGLIWGLALAAETRAKITETRPTSWLGHLQSIPAIHARKRSATSR